MECDRCAGEKTTYVYGCHNYCGTCIYEIYAIEESKLIKLRAVIDSMEDCLERCKTGS